MADTEQNTKWCSNCKREIAVSNFVMHDAHCRRNIILCEECNEPISRSERDEHYQEYHAPVTCDLCSEEFEREKLEEHKKDDCPKRSVKCLYCELEMPAIDLTEHHEFCGSRTDLCNKCQQYIMYKDMQKHEDSDCSFPVVKKQKNSNGFDFMGSSMLQNSSSRYDANEFAINEISRMISSGDTASAGVGPFQQNNLRTMTFPGQSPEATHLQTRNIWPLDIRPGQGAVRKTSKKDKKNFNRERENSSPRESTSHFNNNQSIDELLALQLQKEDDVLLPCEFCGEQFSMDDIIAHQSMCTVTGLSALNMNDVDANETLPNNQSDQLLPSISKRKQPSIIDNVGYTAVFDGVMNPHLDEIHTGPGSEDDTLLPCEFCGITYTKENLIQHQAVCDVNNWYSGRRRPNYHKTNVQSRPGAENPKNSSSTPGSNEYDRVTNSIRGTNRTKFQKHQTNRNYNSGTDSYNQNKKSNVGYNDRQSTDNPRYNENTDQSYRCGNKSVQRGRKSRGGGNRGNIPNQLPLPFDQSSRQGQPLLRNQLGDRGPNANQEQRYTTMDRPTNYHQPSIDPLATNDSKNIGTVERSAPETSSAKQCNTRGASARGTSQTSVSTEGRGSIGSHPSDMGVTGSKARGRAQSNRKQHRGRPRGQTRGNYHNNSYTNRTWQGNTRSQQPRGRKQPEESLHQQSP